MSKTYMANVDSLAIGTPKEFEILHWHAAIKRLPTPGLNDFNTACVCVVFVLVVMIVSL